MSAGVAVKCPVSGCGTVLKVKSSLSSHLARKHARGSHTCCVSFLDSTSGCELSSMNQPVGNAVSLSCSDGTTESRNEEWKDCFVHSLGLFYMMLEPKLIVPVSTAQSIAQKFTQIHELYKKCTISNLQALHKNKAGAAITKQLVTATHNDAFSELNSLFSTDTSAKLTSRKRTRTFNQHV